MTSTTELEAKRRATAQRAGESLRPAHAASSPPRPAATAPDNEPETRDDADKSEAGKSDPVVKHVVFAVIGFVIIAACALAVPKLGDWSDDHGQILVFFGFFLAMSIGGRLFWSGVDALIKRARNK